MPLYKEIISGTGAVIVKTDSGNVVILSGVNTYTGATTVNLGTLEVDGSIATSSLTTVNSGGTLIGIGTVGNTQINSGGIFAPGAAGQPGTSMTIAGNLAFQSGAIYLVQLNPANATLANVTAGGTATLNGTVDASFASGSYAVKQYDILHAATLSGTFGTLQTLNLPAGFTASLSYTNTDAFLDLTAVMGHTVQTGGLNQNQQNVANALNGFFNNGGTLTPGFSTFRADRCRPAECADAGRARTRPAAEKGAFQLMTEYFGLMLDPFVDGRGGTGGRRCSARLRARAAGELPARHRAGLCRRRSRRRRSKASSSAGARGARASAATTRPTAIRRSARTTSRRATSAMPPAWIITSRPTRWRASRSPAAAPTGDWRRGSAAAAAMRSRPASMARPVPARLYAGALAFADHWFTTNRIALRRSAHRALQRPELRRPRRDRLSLRGAADDRRHALRRAAGAELPHPELQRDRRHRRRLRADLQRHERDRHPQRARRALRRSDHARRHAARRCAPAPPGRTTG